MLENYFRLAIRNILKRKAFSAINIVGLTAGMTVCFLILNYAIFELSFDRFHRDVDTIVRLRGGARADSSAASAPSFKEAYPEVLNYAKVCRAISRGVYSAGGKHFRMNECFTATNSVFEIFAFEIVAGDRATPLAGPNSVVITESTARKFFGNADAVGKSLLFNGRADYKVTAVMKDVPRNSHLRFDLLLSWPTLEVTRGLECNTSWILWGFYSYLRLRPGTDIPALQKKLDDFVALKQKEVNRPESFWEEYHLQPLKDIHLKSAYTAEALENGSASTVRFLLIVAFLVIAIAWSNYVNLATARSMERALEVGVRKVAGAGRPQLIRQFMLESLIVNAAALALAAAATSLLLPAFSSFAGVPAAFVLGQDARFWAGLALVLPAGMALSGFYPAVILASVNPAAVFKEHRIPLARGRRLRKGLVVFQFVCSTALIAATLTVERQLAFMMNDDIGAAIDGTLVLQRPLAVRAGGQEEFATRLAAFKTELKKVPGVLQAARSSYVPGDEVFMINEGRKADLPDEATIDVYEVQVDEDFLPMFGLKFLAGRPFSREFPTDRTAVILNDTARRQLGYETPEKAIGTKFIYRTEVPFQVLGVLEDYHQESLKQVYEPLVFLYNPAGNGLTSVRVRAPDPRALVADVQALWDRFYPENPFEYFFLDDHYRRQYGSDVRFLRMFGLFTLLAIFVAGLGLFGLSLFNAVRRTKEVGIRKVLGASLAEILALLVRDFVKLILAANVVALPVFYFAVSRWLDKYPFRTSIGVWFFAYPVLMTVLIALAVSAYHAVKAATADPVRALKYE
jgi:putative ABC transport system permease protein